MKQTPEQRRQKAREHYRKYAQNREWMAIRAAKARERRAREAKLREAIGIVGEYYTCIDVDDDLMRDEP